MADDLARDTADSDVGNNDSTGRCPGHEIREPGRSLAPLAAEARCLLLDFDGPICRLYAGTAASTVAQRVRGLLASRYGCLATHDVDDPLDLLRIAGRRARAYLGQVHAALRAAELEVVDDAAPTPGAREVITACRATGRTVGVVSNNSTAAIEAYLHVHDLLGVLGTVAGRDDADPARMKPSPYLVSRALDALHLDPGQCLLVGDSASDIQAARAAGTRSVGYANRPAKRQTLAKAGADVVIDDMAVLARALLARHTDL